MGLAEDLRRSGQRFAQQAAHDLCSLFTSEFLLNAGTAVELLAKAVVADADPTMVFERPAALTEHERQLILPPARRERQGTFDDQATARVLLAQRRSVTVAVAIDRAIERLRLRDLQFDLPNQKVVASARNSVAHLGYGVDVADLDIAACWTANCEAFWECLGHRPMDLWGSYAAAIDATRLTDMRDLAWSVHRRIALAQVHHLQLGVAPSLQAAMSTGEEEIVRCPACFGPAQIQHRTGPGPVDVQEWLLPNGNPTLTCPSCHLELHGEQQIGLAPGLHDT